MSDHYYSENPTVESDRKTWEYKLRDFTLSFTTDAGVFSKNEIDFGSKVLIEAFEMPLVEGDVLDVGCGYGPIGITLAKQFQDRLIKMVDVNERALQLAKQNAVQNEVENIAIKKSDALKGLEKSDTFAAILTNPPIRAGKKVVHEILETSYEHLVNGGELWVVIQKKQGAPSAIDKLNEVFEEVEVVLKKKGYYIIKSKKG
ncbi:class I SAM-dependent methyltransferase [Sutcliffiella cohnii]|uniref:class I SAM-dependent methyltransferase n=1 Tax=Sutcliffiella cohnii TaxID=33932 RepID=UPI002E1C8A89|nr:class I SAM-dependent methyltransferase [Sutcliffiella cohnii]